MSHDEFHELNDIPHSIWEIVGPEHFALALLGVLIYYAFKLDDAFKLKKFEWKIFFHRNIISFVLGLILAPILIIVLIDKDTQFIISIKINYLTAILTGYFSTTIWKMVVKKVRGRIKKRIDESE